MEKFIVELFKIKDETEFRNKVREEEGEDYPPPLSYFIENYNILNKKYNFNYENFVRLLKNSDLYCCIDERGDDILSLILFNKFKIKIEEFQYILKRCGVGHNEDYMHTLEFVVRIMNANKFKKIEADLMWNIIKESDFSGELGGPMYNLLDLMCFIHNKRNKNNYFTDEQWKYMFNKIEKENSFELSERAIHEIIESDDCSLKEETISCLINKLDKSLFENDDEIKYFLWYFLTTENFNSRKNNLIAILNQLDKKLMYNNFFEIINKWEDYQFDWGGKIEEKNILCLLKNVDLNMTDGEGKNILEYCFFDLSQQSPFDIPSVVSYIIKNVDSAYYNKIIEVECLEHYNYEDVQVNFLVRYLCSDYSYEHIGSGVLTNNDFLNILKKNNLNQVLAYAKPFVHIIETGWYKELDDKCWNYLIKNTDIFNVDKIKQEDDLLLNMIYLQRSEDLNIKGEYWDRIIMKSNFYGEALDELWIEALLRAYKDNIIPITQNTPKIIKKAEKVLADLKNKYPNYFGISKNVN